MKCEIETCKRQTQSYLCNTHIAIARDKNAKFKICDKCNAIIEVRITTKANNKYTFVDECQTCKFK